MKIQVLNRLNVAISVNINSYCFRVQPQDSVALQCDRPGTLNYNICSCHGQIACRSCEVGTNQTVALIVE